MFFFVEFDSGTSGILHKTHETIRGRHEWAFSSWSFGLRRIYSIIIPELILFIHFISATCLAA